MMAGYHRQDLLGEVERDRLARDHQDVGSATTADRWGVESGQGESSSTLWCYVLAHRYTVGAATGGIGGLIGLALLFSLY
jgi:hypothetical protein